MIISKISIFILKTSLFLLDTDHAAFGYFVRLLRNDSFFEELIDDWAFSLEDTRCWFQFSFSDEQ